MPAAAILTEPFAATGEAIAELQGFADYPFATVPHPIGSLTSTEAMAVADAVTPTVLTLLTTTNARPARAGHPTNEEELAGARPQPTRRSEPVGAEESKAPAIGSAPIDIVDELAAVLRADRADLTATVDGRHVTLRLHIPDEACAECILPATMLTAMFQQRFDAELGPGWTITLDDPRAPEHTGPVND